MTVPVQRGTSSDDSTAFQLLLEGMRDVKDQVVRLETHIGARLDGLDQRYIPRAEYEARHSDVRNLITKAEARVEAEAKVREALEEKLTSGRRFMFTASITGVVAVIGLLSLILANLPR